MSQIRLEAVVKDGLLVFDDHVRYRAFLVTKHGKRLTVTIESEVRQRTNAQNARYWSAYVPFASEIFRQQTGLEFDKDSTHELLCKFFLGTIAEVTVGGAVETIRKRSSTLSTVEFSQLSDRVEQWIWESYKVDPKAIEAPEMIA